MTTATDTEATDTEAATTKSGTGPKRPPAKGKKKPPAKGKQVSGFSTLRSKLALGVGERERAGAKRPVGKSSANIVLIAVSLLVNVIALTVIGWFLYARSLPGSEGSVAGVKLYHAEQSGRVRTKEEETARQFVGRMMNFDYHNLDSFAKNMTTGISGQLKQTTGDQEMTAIKQLFTELQVVAKFDILASEMLEDHPDDAVIVVAGRQVLNLKGDAGQRTMSTILKVTVKKRDQSVSSLDSLDPDRKNPQNPGPPILQLPGQSGQAPGQTGQASTPRAPSVAPTSAPAQLQPPRS